MIFLTQRLEMFVLFFHHLKMYFFFTNFRRFSVNRRMSTTFCGKFLLILKKCSDSDKQLIKKMYFGKKKMESTNDLIGDNV